MTWLLIAILSYLFFAVAALIDKYLIAGPIPNPRVMAFYVGLLSLSAILLIPFAGFYLPDFSQIALALSAGFVFSLALILFFQALRQFESSRIVPAIGGLGPLFTFFLIIMISGFQDVLSPFEFMAFGFLIFGSVLITLENDKSITQKSLSLASFASFLFALSFVLTKYVFESQPFWNGFIWKSFGIFLVSPLLFFIFPDVKKEALRAMFSLGANKNKLGLGSKLSFPTLLFLGGQTTGALAAILQNYAIFLAPLALVPVIYALAGVQYIFLLALAFFLSMSYPHILKEEFSKKIIIQKVFAILLILTGLAILTPFIN